MTFSEEIYCMPRSALPLWFKEKYTPRNAELITYAQQKDYIEITFIEKTNCMPGSAPLFWCKEKYIPCNIVVVTQAQHSIEMTFIE